MPFKPQVRGSFSDRNHIQPINSTIQIKCLDQRTRNKIINFFDKVLENTDRYIFLLKDLYDYIYKEIFCVTSDEMPYGDDYCRSTIVEGLKKEWEYDEIFSFLECISRFYVEKTSDYSIYKIENELFEQECVGYRFVDGQIIDITSSEEISEIEQALNCKYSASKNSISNSLRLLYDRENPDYPNSVKESISAIEAICNIILGSKQSLGKALKQLKKNGINIHPSLEQAFLILYGYTSNQSGIRHNNGIDTNTTFEEAKYMLVSCSAFLNYLIQVYEKSKH